MTYISNTINAQQNIHFQSKKTPFSKNCSEDCAAAYGKQVNLDYQGSAISARALVESLGVQNKGTKYEFNPSDAANDVETFEAVADALKSVMELYLQKGYSKEEAKQKAAQFINALIANL